MPDAVGIGRGGGGPVPDRGGILVGVSAWLVKNPPALFLAVGHCIYVGGLTDEERERIITARLMGIDTVQAVQTVEHEPDPNPQSAL